MLRTTILSLAAALALFACPKTVVTNVSGSDDEMMDQYAAQIEELKTKTDLKCDDFCSLKTKACAVSKGACEISGRHAGREDFQKRCVTAQEECARFSESCTSCSGK